MNRFFIEGRRCCGEAVILTGDDAHRIKHVLRLRSGRDIEVCDSAGSVFRATITDLARDVEVLLHEMLTARSVQRLRITLAQCLPKGNKMDYVVEKATELGIDCLMPVVSERVIGAREGGAKVDRWRRIARSAAEQSRGAKIPDVAEPRSWPALLEEIAAYDRCLVPWELAPVRPRDFAEALAGARSLLLVIGPEGGLTHTEVTAAQQHGAVSVSLGGRILRTETAGLVALAVARYEAGDL